MSRDLRHRVAVQHNIHTRVKGVKADNWQTLETVYAKIRTLGGGEVVRAGQNEGLFSHEVETRFRSNFGGVLEVTSGDPLEVSSGVFLEIDGTFYGMLPRYRLLFGSRTFNIHSVVFPYSGSDRVVMRVKEVVT